MRIYLFRSTIIERRACAKRSGFRAAVMI